MCIMACRVAGHVTLTFDLDLMTFEHWLEPSPMSKSIFYQPPIIRGKIWNSWIQWPLTCDNRTITRYLIKLCILKCYPPGPWPRDLNGPITYLPFFCCFWTILIQLLSLGHYINRLGLSFAQKINHEKSTNSIPPADALGSCLLSRLTRG